MGLCPPDITTYIGIQSKVICSQTERPCWYGGVWNKYDMIVAGGVTPEYVDENFMYDFTPRCQ